MSRPSPTASATEYEEFTMHKGNDKNIWCNVNVSNSLRWVKICSIEMNNITDINLKLFDKIIKRNKMFKYIGELPITKCLAIGDSMTFPMVEYNAKKYYIYRYNQCMVASEKKIASLNKLHSNRFKCKTNVAVDAGTFAFYDIGAVERFGIFMRELIKKLIKNKDALSGKNKTNLREKYNLLMKSKNTKNQLYRRFGIPYDKKMKDATTDTFIYTVKNMPFEKDLTIKNLLPSGILTTPEMKIVENEYKRFVFGNDIEKIAIIYGGNYYGDGFFPVLSNEKNTILIQCGFRYTTIIDAINMANENGISKIISGD